MPNNVRIHTQVDGNANKELGGLRDTWKAFQAEGASGLKIAAGVTAGAAAFSLLDRAASAGIDAIGASIDAASNLNETMTKSEVIFGKNSDAVAKWADGMDTAAGQSKKAALDAASGFAGLFKTVGLGIDQSTDMAKGLTQLGSDLASFFNTDVDEALGALKSGLNGEAEPLRRFNVFLSETAVSAKLAEMGVKKTGGAFTEAQKATARYALIMEQTGDAQGDFARTSEGLANKQRILDAEMENLAARVGNVLLPAVVGLTDGFLDMAEAVDKVTDASSGTEDRMGGLNDILRTLNPQAWANNMAFEALGKAQEDAGVAAEEAARDSAKAWDTGSERIGMYQAEIQRDMHRTGRASRDLANEHNRAMRGMVRTAEKTRDDLDELGQEAADSYYGPLIEEADFAATKREIAEQKATIASKKSTREQVRDAKARLIELRQTAMEQETRLIGWGRLSKREQERFLADLTRKWRSSTGEAKQEIADLIAYIRRLNANSNVNINVGAQGVKGNDARHNASGGPNSPYSTIQWQEGNNDEYMKLGAAGARVFPSGGGSGGGGGSMTVNVNVSTPLLTPGGAEALAQAITPHVAKAMQRQQLIPRR